MVQIQPLRDEAIRVSSLIVHSSTGQLIFVLGIIACMIHLWQNREGSLEGRVNELEIKVKDFWIEAANSDSAKFKQGAFLELKRLQAEVCRLPSEKLSSTCTDRIKALYHATLLPDRVQIKEISQETLSLPSEQALTADQWKAFVEKSKQYVNHSNENEADKAAFQQEHRKLLAQVRELYKRSNDSSEIFSCLLCLHRIGGQLAAPKRLTDTIPFQPVSSKFGGIAQSGSNSCYLATALQLFRAIGVLRSKFNLTINPLEDQEKTEIQRTITDMLARMDRGETIPAKESAHLQKLIHTARVITGSVAGMYDAGEIAVKLLELMGFEFPPGELHIVRRTKDKEDPEETRSSYRPVIYTNLNETVDVSAEIHRLTQSRSSIPPGWVGGIERREQVTSLPQFMMVEFLGTQRLTNFERFDDPFNQDAEYKLVFGMEHPGMHWVAHVLCEDGQWVTANDAAIGSTDLASLQTIRRGFYVRRPKELPSPPPV